MPYRTDIAYMYDGSFEGLLSCVFESYDKKEIPFDILSAEAEQGCLFETKWIESDPVKADRVYRSIPVKISAEAQELVRLGYFTCHPQKALLVLRFLRLGFTHGSKVMNMLTDDTVSALLKAVQHLNSEGHKYMGFVRFSVYDQVLAAVIEPMNRVLPVISDHFCDRFHTESFMIYDKTHGMALIHRPGESKIISVDELTLPEIDETEAAYRHLWKSFYDAIAIRDRCNPRLRMSLMPKRYWGRLPEMAETDAAGYNPKLKDTSSRAAESPASLAYTAPPEGSRRNTGDTIEPGS